MQAEVRNPRWRLINGNTHISACTQRSFTISKAISMFWRSRNPMKLFPILGDASRNQKSKMAAYKKENIHFSACIQLMHQSRPLAKQLHTNLTVLIISAQFWQLNTYTEGTGVQWSYSLYCVMRTKIINPRWRLTLKKYWHLNLYTT